MPANRTSVMSPRRSSTRLPEWSNQYCAVVQYLMGAGLLSKLEPLTRVYRQGGYCGLDVFLFLIAALTCTVAQGLRKCWGLASRWAGQLGAVGGRESLPSSSSTSRALEAVRDADCEQLQSGLIDAIPGASELLSHPTGMVPDSCGQPTVVFDLDTTVTTLRLRALPKGADLPEPQRRARHLAAPGHSGRKRGEVQFSTSRLQHAGTGLALGCWLTPGNSVVSVDVRKAVAVINAVTTAAGLAQERRVLRIDGAGGSLPCLTTCREAGIHLVTRWGHYAVLEDPRFPAFVAQATWTEVPDSRSGPQRHATEFGVLTLQPSSGLLRPDGQAYASCDVRVVLTRFRPEKDKRGDGVVKDGWQYELLLVDLDPQAWPAAQAVELYYGRTGLENRLNQENCEFNLNHVFSCAPDGQRWAMLVGLYLWNLYTVLGAELVAPLPTTLPAQLPRPTSPVTPEPAASTPVPSPLPQSAPMACQAVGGYPAALVCDAPFASPGTPDPTPASVPQSTLQTLDVPPPPAPDDSPGCPAPYPRAAPTGAPPPAAQDNAPLDLGSLDWPTRLAPLAGWRWDPEQGLLCADDKQLTLTNVRSSRRATAYAVFRAEADDCKQCTHRRDCTRVEDPRFRKELTIRLPVGCTRDNVIAPTPRVRAAPDLPAVRPVSERWHGPIPCEGGPFDMAAPILVPAELRKTLRQACDDLEVHVSVRLPPPVPLPPPHLALTKASRQHRRQTWADRLAYNALPDGADTRIEFMGALWMEPLLAPSPGRGKEAA